jgi:homoserine kinase
MKRINAFAPATVANVGPGYDILGFAVSSPGDTVELELNNNGKVVIQEITGDQGRLPLDPDKNTATAGMIALLARLESKQGVNVKLHKNMPLGSGMGSSAASSVAAVFALNELLDRPLTSEQLLPFVMESERVACGSAHADNVAPALLGGFVLVRSYSPLDVIKLPTPESLFCTLIHPEIEIKTADARKVLRKDIPLSSLVTQTGNIAGLISALYRSDLQLLSRSLNDVVVEPERSVLIPGFKKVKEAALAAGALGCSISGSGPAMFALSASIAHAESAAAAMLSAFEQIGIKGAAYVSKVNEQGPVLL